MAEPDAVASTVDEPADPGYRARFGLGSGFVQGRVETVDNGDMAIHAGDRRESLRLSIFRLGSIGAAVLLVVVLTVTRSHAAFTATTANSASSLATGNVALTDDDSGTAMFAVTGMSPASSVSKCLVVTYSGSIVPAPVRLYGVSTGSLATYLDTTIEIGSGGSFADCTGFTPSSTLFSGTLASFSATHTNWSSGIAAFTSATTPTSRTIRVTFAVQNNQSAQSLSSTVGFTFETQA